MVTFIVIAVGIGFEAALFRLLFGVYALPFLVGGFAGVAAYRNGAGEIGLFVVGLAAGAITLGIGRHIFENARSRAVRTIVALLFVIPAALMGYTFTLGLAQWLEVPSVIWQHVYAIAAAVIVGAAALDRLAHPIPPDSQ
jgi:hypothetical protein